MLKFELKRLFQGAATKVSLLVFIISGLLAIYLGANSYKSLRIDQVKSSIVFEKEREYIKSKESIPEMGSLAYYASAPTAWQLSPWAALFNGQSQNNLVAMKINALALQGQIHNKEAINPAKHRAGGFDLGFVLAYMLPVLIGVLSVNLLSEERQSGRWRMLSAFANHTAKKLIFRAILWRYILIVLMITVLFVVSAVLLKLPIDGLFMTLYGLSCAYALLWFLIATVIMSFNQSSLFNSLAFIGTWLLFAVLIPGFIHLTLNSQFDNAAPLKAATSQRLILNDGWDQDKQAALAEFTSQYPEYADKTEYQTRFHWKWYYAMHQLSDVAVQEQWHAHLAQQQQSQRWLTQLSLLSPTLFFQNQLNQQAGTDNQAYWHYLTQVSAYHQQIREFIYPYLFNDTPVTAADVDTFPEFTYANELNKQGAPSAWLLLLFIITLGVVSQIRFKQQRFV